MKNRLLVITIIIAWIFTSCSFMLPAINVNQDAVATQSAILIENGRMTATAAAAETQAAVLTTMQAQETTDAGMPTPIPSATLAPVEPTVTIVPPTETLVIPTRTPLPSLTPIPTFTLQPTATVIPCDRASFVADISIPDGTEIAPGSVFTKIWRIKNSGTCTWSSSYSLVFSGGEQMGGKSPQAMPAIVAPGDIIDLSVTLTAPNNEGSYRSKWKLQNASGGSFGIGSNNATIYADIKVKQGAVVNGVDFVSQMCAAEWTSGAGTLPCPGSDGDSKGFVLRINSPVLETGSTDDEPALLTNPQAVSDGVIRGKFPGYTVKTGDKFKAIIGCAYQADNCDVKFQLDYQIGTDTIQTLSTWSEKYDKVFNSVEVDLSSLAGKQVRFILTVFANGEMKQDRAQWLAPRIISQ